MNERLSCEFFRLRIGLAEGFHRHRRDHLRLTRAVAEIRRAHGNLIDHVQTFRHRAERSILSVQMRGSLVHDKELGSGGIGMHGSGHGEDAGGVL